jgi:23S rRNA (uracil1939-C5)-methyltransferase
MVFPAGRDREGKLVFGFYAPRSHTLVPLADCLLGGRRSPPS